jgi:hypothetical protein
MYVKLKAKVKENGIAVKNVSVNKPKQTGTLD